MVPGPFRQNVPWEHYNMLPREEREWMDARMKNAGVTIEQVASGLSYRMLMCAHQLREWIAKILHH